MWKVEAADGVLLQVRDDDGRRHEVLDAMSSWWLVIHGLRNPVLDAAAKHQIDAEQRR